MLRSRVENRPNSSVTDFRRQLTKLQAHGHPAARRSPGHGPPARPVAAQPPGRRRSPRSADAALGCDPAAVEVRTLLRPVATPRRCRPARGDREQRSAPTVIGERRHGDPTGQSNVTTPPAPRRRDTATTTYRGPVRRTTAIRPAVSGRPCNRHHATGEAAPLERVVRSRASRPHARCSWRRPPGSTVMLYAFVLGLPRTLRATSTCSPQIRRHEVGSSYDNWFD